MNCFNTGKFYDSCTCNMKEAIMAYNLFVFEITGFKEYFQRNIFHMQTHIQLWNNKYVLLSAQNLELLCKFQDV